MPHLSSMGHSLGHSVWMKREPVQPRSAQCGSSLFLLCIFQPVEKPWGWPAPPLCCPATLSPLNCHLSLILGPGTKIKERAGRRKLGNLVILFERSIRSLGNIFLAGESEYLGSKSSIPSTGAPLAVSSNHTYILVPGLQLGGEASTLCLPRCKALSGTYTHRHSWVELGARPWHGEPSSRCTPTPPFCAWHGPSRPRMGSEAKNLSTAI